MSTNPFKAGTGKARLLDALRRGDVDAYLFSPVVGSKLAFDGMKPIGRLAPRVEELRNKHGYGIDDVATPDVGHSIYRLVSEPHSSPAPSARRDIEQAANDGDRVMGGPVAVPHRAHVGINLEADGFGPDIPACGPAWADSMNPYAESMPDVPLGAGRFSVYADPDDDGDESWITEEAA